MQNELLNKVELRQPREQDGKGIWSLVKETKVLDLNSAYSYLMLCKYFPDTCVVAESNGEIVGFLSAFQPPSQYETIFVWQVAVAHSQRRRGLGGALLKELLQRKSCEKIRFLETTISPSNKPSQSLFKGLARELETECNVLKAFPARLFPEGEHEDEMLYRVGPFAYLT